MKRVVILMAMLLALAGCASNRLSDPEKLPLSKNSLPRNSLKRAIPSAHSI